MNSYINFGSLIDLILFLCFTKTEKNHRFERLNHFVGKASWSHLISVRWLCFICFYQHIYSRFLKFNDKWPNFYFVNSISVHSVISNSLKPHGLQHPRVPCSSQTPGACSNSCASNQWYYPTVRCLHLTQSYIKVNAIKIFSPKLMLRANISRGNEQAFIK